MDMLKKVSLEGGIFKFLVIFLFVALFATPAMAERENSKIKKATRTKEELKIQGILIDKEEVRRFYNKKNNQLVWFDELGGIKPIGEQIIKIMEDSKSEGLKPEDYQVSLLKGFAKKIDKKDVVERDLILSNAALLYTHHIVFGRKKPEGTQFGYYYKDKEKEKEIKSKTAEHYLNQALNSDDFAKYLNLLLPRHEFYQSLKKLLADLEKEQANKGSKDYAQISIVGKDIEPEGEDKRIPQIRDRMRELKFYKASGIIPHESKEYYEEDLFNAIKNFQKAMGIDETGKIGTLEIKLMNIKIADKIKLVKTNLERWRWMKRDLGEKFVLVNLPAFNLKAFKNREQILDMNAIVGTPDKQTPIMSTYITDVILNPFWHVPKRIAVENLLPQLIEDPKHVKDYGFEFIKQTQDGKWKTEPESSVNVLTLDSKNFPYLLRQKPGYLNSLGKVRFSIFSDYGVYMHGTPDHSYFTLDDRAFSSGCVRLEFPLDLIYFVLEKDPNWPKKKIREFYYQNTANENDKIRSINVSMNEEVPVHFIYQTIWREKNGILNIREDSYKSDYMMINDYGL
jgi:murein L,D-transpeptidase YcbB/YkuD